MTTSPLSYGPFISRKQAQEQGLKKYYTGKPCKRAGHTDVRFVRGGCASCCAEKAADRRHAKPKAWERNTPGFVPAFEIAQWLEIGPHFRDEKKCRACGDKKPIRYTSNGRCVACNSKRVRKYKAKPQNRAKFNETRRKHYNSRSVEERRKIREARNPYFAAYMQNRRQDPLVTLVEALRRRQNNWIKGNKAGSTQELTGCTWEQVRNHLENQFQPGMTWDNHGIHGWHIDHIRPCASFDLTDPEQQKQCFHYTNLQPLWAKDNLAKSDTWEPMAA